MAKAKFEGRESLLRKMKAMPQAVRGSIRQALDQGSDEILTMQRRLVKKVSGDLHDSLQKTWGGGRVRYSQRWGRQEDAGDPDLTVRLSAGNAKVRYAHLVEFGTAPHSAAKGARKKYSGMVHALTNKGKARQHPGSKPQPFFFPPYRALRRRVRSRVGRATSRAVRSMARK